MDQPTTMDEAAIPNTNTNITTNHPPFVDKLLTSSAPHSPSSCGNCPPLLENWPRPDRP